MSVAFRRESDEEHLEPKFERPIAPGPNLVTARGLDLIRAAVAEAEAAVAAAPDEATRESLRRDLRYWQTRLATARVAPPPADGEAGIGSRVRLRLDGTERVVEIVGGDEADPAADRLAFSAPLARALIGAGEGDRLPFAGREDAIEVLAVEARG
jgi:transcription elongation GreA/GreB family factor